MSEGVNGLTTPALTDGEFMDAVSEIKKEEPKSPSAIDLAQGIELKIKELMESMKKDDEEMAQRLSKVSDSIEALRQEL